MVLVLIQSSKLFKYYPGVGCLHSTLSIWDLGPLTLSGDRGRPDGEYPWPHSPGAPSCRCCLVGASTGSGVLIGPNVTVSITHPRIWPYYGHIELTVTTCTPVYSFSVVRMADTGGADTQLLHPYVALIL